MKVLVAMSGGVDSSAICHILKKHGHDLVGVQFTLWSDPLAPLKDQLMPKKCCNAQTMARAKYVAEDLGFPFRQMDISNEFKEKVVDPFIEDFKRGLTPSPCVNCNRDIKFGKLLEIADEMGCDKIATGHYAQIEYDETSARWLLKEAVDPSKDQSYFLSQLRQDQLARSLFPLGTMLKTDVMKQARAFGIPLPKDYLQSQDLCFFPEKEPHAFLDRYIDENTGDIIDTAGKKRGTHRGLHHFTEGQRKGLGIGGLKIPLHVISKDIPKNRLLVGTKEEAHSSELTASNINWVSAELEKCKEYLLEARISSLGDRIPCSITHDEEFLYCKLDTPQLGISPGQFVVFYRENSIIGGGLIYS